MMKKNYMVLLPLLLILHQSILSFRASAKGRENDSEKQFSELSPSVLKIVISEPEDTHGLTHGTGIVASANGLVLTSYHVVSAWIVEANSNQKIFVLHDNVQHEAKVVAVDVIHDLALLKVTHSFEHIPKFSQRTLRDGGSIFSLGFPNNLKMVIVVGIYNGVLNAGPYEQFLLSAPLNSGMSGGPTIDENGTVVGVSVAIKHGSQNLGFAIPIKYALPLIESVVGREFREVSRNDILMNIGNQLRAIQNKLLSGLLDMKPQRAKLGSWEIPMLPSDVQCEDGTIRRKPVKIRWLHCVLNAASFVDENFSAGSYGIAYKSIENIGYDTMQFAYFMNRNFSDHSDNVINGNIKNSNRRQEGEFSCGRTTVNNSHGVTFKVSICFSPLLKFDGLYRFAFKAGTITTSEKTQLIIEGEFSGISRENATQLVLSQLNGVNRLR